MAEESLRITGSLDTVGGLLDAGQAHVDAEGRQTLDSRVVWGSFSLQSGGAVLAGRNAMSVHGRLDANDNGALYGTVALVAEHGGARSLVWEGHWLAQCVRRALTGTIVARGRGRFAGLRMRLAMTESGTAGGQRFRVEGSSRAATALGVTGITTSLGEALSPGERSYDREGRLRIRHWRVTGPVLLNVGGTEVRGKEFFDVNLDANLGDESTGAVFGPYVFTMSDGDQEVPIFAGHFGGRLLRGIGASKLVACGRGPFAGHKLDVDMEELPATEVNPHPSVYLMDGFATLEDGVGVTGLSNSHGRFEAGRTSTDAAGRTEIRGRSVTGDLSLRIGETVVEGEQVLSESAVVEAGGSGSAWGPFRLTGSGGATVWQGHWAGRVSDRSAEMVGLGRGPFAGKRIDLKLLQVAPFEGNPSPQIYILEGVVNEVAGVGVSGIATVVGGLAAPAQTSRDELGRRRARRRGAEGEWSLRVGEAEDGGRQVMELDAALDDRQSGPFSGRFTFRDGGGAVAWEGSLAGRLRESIAACALVGRGRGRCAGRTIALGARETDPPGEARGLTVLLIGGSTEATRRGEIRP